MMNKELREQVRHKHGYKCRLCGIGEHIDQELEVHHIFGGNGRRKQTERIECLAYLCPTCHRGDYIGDTRSVEQNTNLDIRLKREAQRELKRKGYSEEQIREIVGGQLY